MEDGNAQMAAMQAKFEETIAKLREDLAARLRVEKVPGSKQDNKGEGGEKEGNVVGHILRRARWW